MRSFEMSSTTPSEFVRKVRAGLAERGYDRRLSVSLDGDRLTVTFSWMGTTSFGYRITESGDGFRADLTRRRISPLHAAFTDRFERYFERALSEVGAKVI
ncbi:MAG TPA: hypothetical protein VLT32_24170 [Candidatus Sulfomarinibacteraceae bacterium]|nr:hypothetical protein [Candidatus Sulfomarinibacteraceae bacterium]